MIVNNCGLQKGFFVGDTKLVENAGTGQHRSVGDMNNRVKRLQCGLHHCFILPQRSSDLSQCLSRVTLMEEVKILLVAASVGFAFWRRDDCHLTKPPLQAGMDQPCHGKPGANEDDLTFAETLKTCRCRVAKRIIKGKFSGIDFTLRWTQGVGKVLARIFEKAT